MSLADVGITLNIQNNQSYPIQMNVLGNPFNPLDTANAKIQYQFNFTTFTFTNEDSITIQYKPVGASTFSTFTQQLQSQNIQGIVNALNLLGIGSFQTYTQGGQTYVSTYNDNYVFGSIDVFNSTNISGSVYLPFVVGTGFNGAVGTNGGPGTNNAISIQTDGKLVVGGFFGTYNGVSTGGANITRLNTDGSRDLTFSPATTLAFTLTTAIQTDGKILAGGGFSNPLAPYIVRFTTTGSVDATFVTGTGFDNNVYGVFLQSDGNILVIGNFSSYNGTPANRMIRLTTLGAVDGTFVYGTGFTAQVYSLAIQTDGSILVGGAFTSYNGTPANRIIRLTTLGAIDGTFAYGTGFNGSVLAIAIQTDGKIIMGGSFTSYNGTPANRIIRLNTDGSVDTSFIYGTGFDNSLYVVEIQTDGKILVGGLFTTYQGTPANRIIRLNTDGSIDTTFLYGSGFDALTSSIALNNAQIYVGGTFTTYQGLSYNRIISINQ